MMTYNGGENDLKCDIFIIIQIFPVSPIAVIRLSDRLSSVRFSSVLKPCSTHTHTQGDEGLNQVGSVHQEHQKVSSPLMLTLISEMRLLLSQRTLSFLRDSSSLISLILLS